MTAFAGHEGEDATAYAGVAYQAGTWRAERRVVCKARTLFGQLMVIIEAAAAIPGP
jgi:crotonobetainyl-CoA:carnitine CoA-transferase CaiB-like acyl-CoA transferase